MKKLLILLVTFQVTTNCFALLAPLYESAREIKLILDDPRLESSLGAGQTIQSIVKNEKGFEIETEELRLQVHVTTAPPEKPGPLSLTLDFEKPLRIK